MITDYKYRIEPRSKKPLKLNIKWGIIAIILLQSTFIFYQSSKTSTEQTKTETEAKEINNIQADVISKEFQFYYLLSDEIESVVADNEVNTRTREAYFGQGQNKVYSLQMGSFRDIAQAKKLRQELLKLDLNASIEIHKKGITTWNRIVINHLSILEVRANKAVLRKHKVDALVIEKTI